MGKTSFITIDRSIQEWEWYTSGNVLRVFLDLLLNANYEPKEWLGRLIRRGQFVTSMDKICERTGMTKSQVRTALEHLRSTGEILYDPLGHYSLVTIRNYEKYQSMQRPQPQAEERSTFPDIFGQNEMQMPETVHQPIQQVQQPKPKPQKQNTNKKKESYTLPEGFASWEEFDEIRNQ